MPIFISYHNVTNVEEKEQKFCVAKFSARYQSLKVFVRFFFGKFLQGPSIEGRSRQVEKNSVASFVVKTKNRRLKRRKKTNLDKVLIVLFNGLRMLEYDFTDIS